MSREITKTHSKIDLIPEGTRKFIVAGEIKNCMEGQTKIRNSLFGPFSLMGNWEQALMPNMMGPLLRVLGQKETSPNEFDWETTGLEGMQFTATVKHAPDKKDRFKTRSHMGDFSKGEHTDENEIPFGND